MKIIRDEFIKKDPEGARKAVLSEVLTLKALRDHANIIKLLDYGDNGQVYKPATGRTVEGLVYIVLEYVEEVSCYSTSAKTWVHSVKIAAACSSCSCLTPSNTCTHGTSPTGT